MPKCNECSNTSIFTYPVSGYVSVIYSADEEGDWYSRDEETEIDFIAPLCGECSGNDVTE